MMQGTGVAQPGGMMPFANDPNVAPSSNQREAPPPNVSGISCHPCGPCDMPIDKAARLTSYIDLAIQGFEITLMALALVAANSMRRSFEAVLPTYEFGSSGGLINLFVLYAIVSPLFKTIASICLVCGVRKFQVKVCFVYVWLVIMCIDTAITLITFGLYLRINLEVLIFCFRCYAIWIIIIFLKWNKEGVPVAGGMQMAYPATYQPVSQYPSQNQAYANPAQYPGSYPAPVPVPEENVANIP